MLMKYSGIAKKGELCLHRVYQYLGYIVKERNRAYLSTGLEIFNEKFLLGSSKVLNPAPCKKIDLGKSLINI